MKKLLNQIGIMKGIVQVKLMAIERNSIDLEFLMSRWTIDTHTFMATWGEFSPSLEDVAMLMSLPFFGMEHAIGVTLKEKD